MRSLWILVFMIAVPSPLLGQEHTPVASTFQVAACPFDDTNLGDARLTCGFLTVPESRHHSKANPRMIRVAVAIAEPPNARPDPVVLIPGGPGGAPLPRYIERFRDWVPSDRSVIVFDPRGTGFSGGAMCPELGETYSEIAALDLSRSEARALRDGAQRLCRNRLLREGFDLDAYNTETVAQDLVDLRQALGVEQWNLVSVSYGVPFAREAMRRDGKGVRSSVLALGPSPNLTEVLTRDVPFFQRALRRVSDGCANARPCAERFPDLESEFIEVVESLRAEPITVEADRSEFRLPRFTVNAQDFAQIIYWLLGSERDVAYLPGVIRAFAARDVEVVRAIVEDSFGGLNSGFSSGMALSVMCYDAATPGSEPAWLRSALEAPAGFGEIEFLLSHCGFWSEGRAPADVRQPTQLAIPTLVITGEYDPMNPPVVGDEHLQTLPLGFHVTIPGMGHMPRTRSRACWAKLIRTFIQEPTSGPETQCAESLQPVKISPEIPEWLRGPRQ